MCLFLLLAIMLVLLVGFIILTVSVGGSLFILIFADVIVCILIITWIMKRLIGRKH